MMCLMTKNTRTEAKIAIRVRIIVFGARYTKSNRLWKNGIKKAPTIIPIIVVRSTARRGLSGFEIQ